MIIYFNLFIYRRKKIVIKPGKRVTYLVPESPKCFTYLMYLKLLEIFLIVKRIYRFFYFSFSVLLLYFLGIVSVHLKFYISTELFIYSFLMADL